MSKIMHKLSEMVSPNILRGMDEFISKIQNCGNDKLEIECDVELPQNVLQLIKDIHCYDGNHSLSIIYRHAHK